MSWPLGAFVSVSGLEGLQGCRFEGLLGVQLSLYSLVGVKAGLVSNLQC